ncbi:unnamed protein product [Nippostrongylus brasiliensis]|uniref:Uncharacterized protein n=1 Tax=Nippostrongylus brasiliensis TaxID=27835 RepID=A0A0N4XNX1_NIPBR|nr:unnamed protein product [Nippostrongylus brasiliensis]
MAPLTTYCEIDPIGLSTEQLRCGKDCHGRLRADVHDIVFTASSSSRSGEDNVMDVCFGRPIFTASRAPLEAVKIDLPKQTGKEE